MFIAIAIELQPRVRQAFTIADGVYAHAAMLHLLSHVDVAAGRRLHDLQRSKPITIALVEDRQRTILRLTCMAQDGMGYAHSLVNALLQQTTLRIGKTICDVGPITTSGTSWSGISTWTDLMTETTHRSMCFTFKTPTAITKCDASGNRFMALLPEPLDVFLGLARRWKGLQGEALPEDLSHFIESGGCVIADYHLETVKFCTSERTQIGFIGRVVYECRKHNPLYITALNALARLAFFTGVGYQTARGMGATRTMLVL